MQARPYQQQYIDGIHIDQSNMLVAPMRAGKSYILEQIIDKYFSDKKVLIIIGMRNVILQLAEYYTEADRTFILSGKPFDNDKRIHLATFQTYTRRDIDLSQYDLVAIDEIHIRFNTDIVKQIRKLSCTRLYLSGTPINNRNKFLSDEFDNVMEFTNVKKMIEDEFLAETKFFSLGNLIGNGQDLKVRNGDYANEDIDRIIDKSALMDWLIADNDKYGWSAQHKTIMYTNSIATATKIMDRFNSPDVRVIHSKLTKTESEEVMDWFENTTHGIIINCRMLTVGVDIPSADRIVYLVPTKIHSLFLQSIFRASTKFGDKVAEVYDYSGMLGKVSPYWHDWKSDKGTCLEQCAKLSDPIEQYFCADSCKGDGPLIPCTGRLPSSYADYDFIGNFKSITGEPCGESNPMWEYQYKRKEPSIGLITKYTKCKCGYVSSYDVQTIAAPSDMIEVYEAEPTTTKNTITILYSRAHKKAIALLDAPDNPTYKVTFFDSSEEMYEGAVKYFNNKPFQIISNIAMPKLANVHVDRGLDAAIPLVSWDSGSTSGFIKRLIKMKMEHICEFHGIKSGWVYYQMKGITKQVEKPTMNFLIQSDLQRADFLKYFKKLNKDN